MLFTKIGNGMKKLKIFASMVMLFILAGCSKTTQKVVEIKNYPLDNLEGIITKSNVTLDKEISFDGKGSLKITVDEPAVIRLFETGDIDAENARLIYRTHLKTENLEGQVYLEMRCHCTLSGTNDWITQNRNQ